MIVLFTRICQEVILETRAGTDIDIRADLNFVGDIDNVLVKVANVAWNVAESRNTTLTLEGDLEIDNPTNMVNGGKHTMLVTQDATGSRTVTWGSAYKWPGGTAPTLSTGVNDIDKIKFYTNGTNMFGTFALDFS